MLKVWRLVQELSGKYRRDFYIILCLMMIEQAYYLIPPWIMGQVVVAIPQENWRRIAVLLTAGFIGRFFTLFCKKRMSLLRLHRFDSEFDKDVKSKYFRRLLGLPLGEFDFQNRNNVQGIINQGVRSINNLIDASFFRFLPMLASVFISSVALFCYGWRIGLAGLLFIAFAVYSGIRYAKWFLPGHRKMRSINERVDTISGEIGGNARNIVANANVCGQLGRLDNALADSSAFANELYGESIARSTNMQKCFVAFEAAMMLAVFWSYGWRGAELAAVFIVIMSWFSRLNGNISQLIQDFRQVGTFVADVERMEELIFVAEQRRLPEGNICLGSLESSIVFEGLSFAYPHASLDRDKGVPALANINLEFKVGEKIGVVGKNGAGKSTLIKLLLRGCDPQIGNILIDGHNLRDLDLAAWRKRVAWVDARAQLYDEDIMSNISYGAHDGRCPDNVDDIIESTQLGPFIEKHGLEARIGDAGAMMSDGEKQRLIIARSLAKKPEIIIFDEATSHLDSVAEKIVQDKLLNQGGVRLAIFIAHRFSTLRGVDRIVVLGEGKVLGFGTHTELLQSCAAYNEILQQF